MSTTNLPPTGPERAARSLVFARALPYLQAAAYAFVLVPILFVTNDPVLALRVTGGVLVVLVVHQIGHDVAGWLFRLRIDPLDRELVLRGCVLPSEQSERRAWVGLAGPFAGTVASIGALVLCAHHAVQLPLLMTATIGLAFNAFCMLPVPPQKPDRRAVATVPALWLVGVVCLGLVAHAAFDVVERTWGFAVLLLVAVQCFIGLRAEFRRASGLDRPARRQPRVLWCAGFVGTWFAIAGGLWICAVGLDVLL